MIDISQCLDWGFRRVCHYVAHLTDPELIRKLISVQSVVLSDELEIGNQVHEEVVLILFSDTATEWWIQAEHITDISSSLR